MFFKKKKKKKGESGEIEYNMVDPIRYSQTSEKAKKESKCEDCFSSFPSLCKSTTIRF